MMDSTLNFKQITHDLIMFYFSYVVMTVQIAVLFAY